MGFPPPPRRPVKPLEPTAENEQQWIMRWDLADGRTFMEWCADGGMPHDPPRYSRGTESTGCK